MPTAFYLMIELKDFYNKGFGWICRQCERDQERGDEATSRYSRVFREGEAESKTPKLASHALAKWTDITRCVLICPHCGVSEEVEKS